MGVVLLVAALVIALSFFNQAGRVGAALLSGIRRLFGWPAYLVPLAMGYAGYRCLWPGAQPPSRWRLVGAALAAVGVVGIMHLIGVPLNDSLQVAAEGKGGGYLGFLFSYPLSAAFSPVVALLLFLAAAIIGFFMTFNLSPADIAKFMSALMPRAGEQEEEEAAEDGETAAAPPRFRISGMTHLAKPDPKQLPLDDKIAQREAQQKDLRREQVRAANKRYTPPPLDLLATATRQPEGGDVEANKEIIASTLRNFGITVTMGKAKVGPTVTQYTLRPDEGIRLSQITALQNDLARALMAHPVRLEAPIPNTDLVGIEIPNKEVALVRLRELLSSKEMRHSESPLAMALGKDVAGAIMTAELDRMPHVLIAGATNSGKSVCIHSILMSLLYRNSPALLRLILVDPKRVELTAYNGIPHLWGEPVIVDTNKTLNALKWALREMDQRYKLLEEAGSRNLFSYNISNPDKAMPFIVIVIDELADLMAKHAREVEGPVVRLSQLARAVGIHLVLATQRPSVNVITGLIKANVPTRIAFKVASQVDSRTIIDMAGAEKLLGTGDMLFLATDNTNPRRLQGGYVSEEEVRQVVKFIVDNNSADEFMLTEDSITSVELPSLTGGEAGDDTLFEEAKRIAMDAGKVSASLLQRRLRVGYARAARLLDILEEQGVIGHAEGNKPREVLLREEGETFGEAKEQPRRYEAEDLPDEETGEELRKEEEPW